MSLNAETDHPRGERSGLQNGTDAVDGVYAEHVHAADESSRTNDDVRSQSSVGAVDMDTPRIQNTTESSIMNRDESIACSDNAVSRTATKIVAATDKENYHGTGTTIPGIGRSVVNSSSNASKKRRLNTLDQTDEKEELDSRRTTSIPPPNDWQDIYRHGARFKTMLDGVLVQVASVATEKAASALNGRVPLMAARNNGQDGNLNDSTNVGKTGENTSTADNSHRWGVSELLQSKATELQLLRQDLEDVTTSKASLEAINKDLRNQKLAQDSQVQQLTEALQRASDMATKARHDADEAQEQTQTLSSKLEALEVVVRETKQASRLLMVEQNELAQRSQDVEQRFVEAQADLARSESSKTKMEESHVMMKSELAETKRQLKEKNSELESERAINEKSQKEIQELRAMKETYQERLQRLEEDLQKSQDLFLDVSTTATETTEAKKQLQAAFEKVQHANTDLHRQLHDEQQSQREKHMQYQESLANVQEELRASMNERDSIRDELAKLKLEKAASEKKAKGLTSRVVNLERRLNESMDLVGTSTSTNMNSFTPVNESADKGQRDDSSMTIPALQGGIDGTMSTTAAATIHGKNALKCAVCFKAITGPSRKCQCGKKECTVRAHAQCAQRVAGTSTSTSVSHPGTPAPKLPIVLCRSICTNDVATSNVDPGINAITPAEAGDRRNRASF